jgi:hypothetical protein
VASSAGLPIDGLGTLDGSEADDKHPACEPTRVHGRKEAWEVFRRRQQDHAATFGQPV